MGAPIIIAGHSQGALHAAHLLMDFFDGKTLQSKLVASYTIGYALNPNDFTSLTACNQPDETGCMCSWRTYKQGYVPLDIKNENFDAIVTNPLTWKASKPVADQIANKGGNPKDLIHLFRA